MLTRLLALLALCLLASPAAAWWEYGHYSVGRIAMLEVKPATRAAIRRLIAQSKLLETPACPIRTIEEASYWPDCVKTLGDRFSYAFSWHYQNVDICKPFDLTAACKDGNCVSAQIERNLKLLADEAVPTRERAMALAFLVHLMGDLHQPLHAGDRGDRGGNDFKAAYGVIPSNLHAIWDGLLADRAISSPPPDAAGILAGLMPDERARMGLGTVEDWSRESWAAAREFGYGALMADPCGPLPGGAAEAGRSDDPAPRPDPAPPGGARRPAPRPPARRGALVIGAWHQLPTHCDRYAAIRFIPAARSPRGGSGPRRPRRSRAPRAAPCRS